MLAGLPIGRVLPYRRRRCIGPFIFLGHMGPHRLDAGPGLYVGPHPHVGLATPTSSFAGAILHRAGLGVRQR